MSDANIDVVLRARDMASGKVAKLNKELDKLKQKEGKHHSAGQKRDQGGKFAASQASSSVKSAKSMGAAWSSAGSAMTQTGTAVARVALPMAAGLGSAAKHAAEYDQAVRNIQAKTTGSSLEEIQKVGEEARRIAKLDYTTATSSEVLGGGLFLAQAGFSADEQVAAMETVTKMAAASGATIDAAGDITTNIMSGFGIKAEELSQAGDILARSAVEANVDLLGLGMAMKFVAPVAKTAGAKLEDTAAMIGVLGNAGIHGTMAGRSLRAMYLRLADPPKKAAKALDMLNVSVKDSKGNFKDMPMLLHEINQKTKGLGSAKKAEIVNQIFGKNASSTALALIDNLDEYAKVRSRVGAAHKEDALTEMAKTMTSGDMAKFTKMKRDMVELAVDVGPPLIDMLQDLFKELAPVIKGISSWAKENPGLVKTVGGLTIGLLALTPVLMGVGSALSAAGSIMSMFGGSAATAAIGVGKLAVGLSGVLAAALALAGVKAAGDASKNAQGQLNMTVDKSGVGMSSDFRDKVGKEHLSTREKIYHQKRMTALSDQERLAMSMDKKSGIGGLIGRRKRGYGGMGQIEEIAAKEMMLEARRERLNALKGHIGKDYGDVTLKDFGASSFIGKSGKGNIISRALQSQREGKIAIELRMENPHNHPFWKNLIKPEVTTTDGDFEIETKVGDQ